MNVAIVGASNKPDRYSYKALKLLLEHGHQVFPVHPRINDIEGMHVFLTVKDIPDMIDTVTLYVSENISLDLATDIIEKKPKRIIFNPGAENPSLFSEAQEKGINPINGCTLVLLKTNQF